MFVIVGGLAVVLSLLYFAIVAPYRSAMSRLDRQIAARSVQLHEVKVLQGRYLQLQSQMNQVTRLLGKRQDFSALTFIEGLVEQTAGRENLLSMRPQSPETRNEFTIDSVEIKLERLTLKQLLELLLGFEGATMPMQVKSLTLKQRFDDRSLLDASMTVKAMRRTT